MDAKELKQNSLLHTKEIAIDLGTANTRIFYNDKMVLEEPSIVAIERLSGNPIGAGKSLYDNRDFDIEYLDFIRYPLQGGVIAYPQTAEFMLTAFLRMANIKPKLLFSPALKVLVCISPCITEAEEQTIRNVFKRVGAKKVWYIHTSMAAAIGIGLNVLEPEGNVIVDIGGGTSEIAVIALGGIVSSKSVKTAGIEFNTNIVDCMRREHNIFIDERTAELIKINVGAAMSDIDSPPPSYKLTGRDLLTDEEKTISITHHEIAVALDASISQIETAILSVLEQTPPELLNDIKKSGIYLTGGSSLLRGLDKRISLKTKLPIHITDDPLNDVVHGAAIALKNIDRFLFIIR